MSGENIRWRFFDNGASSAGQSLHDRYLIPGQNLLRSLDVLKMPKREHVIEHGPVLAGIAQEGAETVKHYVTGAVIRAYGGPHPEIHVDAITRTERSGGGGGEEGDEPVPYLWVGARIAWDRMVTDSWVWDSEITLAVWEPFDTANNLPRGIVATDPVVFFDGPNAYTVYSTLGGSQGTDSFAAQMLAVNPRPEAVRPLWWFSPSDSDTADHPLVQSTQHGLYHINGDPYYGDLNALSQAEAAGLTFIGHHNRMPDAPYDPFAGPDDWRERIVGRLATITWSGVGQDGKVALWPYVTVLDPRPDLAPADAREDIAINQMFTDLGTTPTVIDGLYAIKVSCNSFCWPDRPLPIEVDIEVRVNKAPNTRTERYAVTIPAASAWPRANCPYGWRFNPDTWWYFQHCPYESGENPHYNWWQGAILVDVKQGLLSREEVYVPEHGFLPQTWNPLRDSCNFQAPVLIFVAASYPTSAPWSAHLADAFALSIVNWDLGSPWQTPQELPASSSDPSITQAIAIKAKAIDASVSDGVVYQWGSQPIGVDPVGAFTRVEGVIPDPVNQTPWINALTAIATAGGYSYAVVILVGLIAVQRAAAPSDGCAA